MVKKAQRKLGDQLLYFNDLPISQSILSRLFIFSLGLPDIYDHSDSHVTIIREPNELEACFLNLHFQPRCAPLAGTYIASQQNRSSETTENQALNP